MAYIISHLSLSNFLRLIGWQVCRVLFPACSRTQLRFAPDKCSVSAVIKEKYSQELQGKWNRGYFYFIKCHDYFSEQLVMLMQIIERARLDATRLHLWGETQANTEGWETAEEPQSIWSFSSRTFSNFLPQNALVHLGFSTSVVQATVGLLMIL